jgi:multicomponent Na+:H+ antiporter subunit E
MNFLLLNVLLAISWAALTGQLSPQNIAGGFLVGYIVMFMSRRALGSTSYVAKVPQVIRFFSYFFWQLLLSNLRVAYEVLTPSFNMRPAIVAIPLDLRGDLEITLLANLITLTPGTLSLDVSSDKRVLYVHAMFVTDIDEFRNDIKNGFEKRVKELFS